MELRALPPTVWFDGDGQWWRLMARCGGKLGWAIQDVSMTAPGMGWIVANGPSASDFLAHTGDNGARWTVAWPPRAPVSVDFVSPTSGYGTGLPDNANAIVATQDGGRHWSNELSRHLTLSG